MKSNESKLELPSHPAFLRLSEKNRELLIKSADLWEAPDGGVILHPGDSGEELILLIDGRLEEAGNENGRQWLSGEMWGENRLLKPVPVENPLKAVGSGMWLSWPRSTLVSLADSSRTLVKELAPLKGENGKVVSGLLEGIPSSGGFSGRRRNSGRSGKGQNGFRRFRSSIRRVIPFFIITVILSLAFLFAVSKVEDSRIAFLPVLPLALFSVWFIAFIFKRLLTEYSIDADGLSSRSFTWSRFAVESRMVPADRILGVSVERNGLLRRILNYGTLKVKTAAMEGDLVLNDVSSPQKLASEIKALSEAASRRNEGRSQEALRRSLERAGAVSGGVRLLRQGSPVPNGAPSGKSSLYFRKSPAILFGRLLLPLLCTFLFLAVPYFLKDNVPKWTFAFSLIPFFWLWYRFEDWRNDNFRVEGGYAVDVYRKPLGLKESRRQVSLLSVQNIQTEQKGFFSFLFRYGDVLLITAGGASDAVFSKVARPWRVQEKLFRAREDSIRKNEERQRAERQDELVRFAAALDKMRKNSN